MTRLILHDLPAAELPEGLHQVQPEDLIFSALPAVRPCLGCFNCWLKTPGVCVIKDRAQDFAKQISCHDELIIISRLVYGGLSPEVKAVVDRSIAYMLPFFRVVNGQMRHRKRYKQPLTMRFYFHANDYDADERQTAETYAQICAENFAAQAVQASFFASAKEAGEAACALH